MLGPELEMEVDELCNLDTNREPTEKEMYDIYCWIDNLEFSRSKKNIARDFSDGVLMAELMYKYLPRIVELGNFSSALSKKNKFNNWEHLNAKVFNKLGYKMDKQKVDDIMESKAGAIERVLFELRPLIARKNRSILNYRIGQKPEIPEVVLKQPHIPMGMTQAAQLKRRPRSIQIQNTEKISFGRKSRSRPAPTTRIPAKEFHLPVKGNHAIEEQILPNDIKLITVEPVVSSANQLCHNKPLVDELLEAEIKNESLNDLENGNSWTTSPPTTAHNFEIFGEQVFLSGSTPDVVNEGKIKLDGIPGVHLGFYGLV